MKIEAETCLVLNAKDDIQSKYKQVVVICRGTDVLLPLYHLGCTDDVRNVKAEKGISSVQYFIETTEEHTWFSWPDSL